MFIEIEPIQKILPCDTPSLRVNDKEIVFSRDAVELLGITEVRDAEQEVLRKVLI
jgi:hypothetical protein